MAFDATGSSSFIQWSYCQATRRTTPRIWRDTEPIRASPVSCFPIAFLGVSKVMQVLCKQDISKNQFNNHEIFYNILSNLFLFVIVRAEPPQVQVQGAQANEPLIPERG